MRTDKQIEFGVRILEKEGFKYTHTTQLDGDQVDHFLNVGDMRQASIIWGQRGGICVVTEEPEVKH